MPPIDSSQNLTRLGSFEILAPVGETELAVVYCARHTASGLNLALKVLKAKFAADGNYIEQFQREVKIARHLRHPDLVEFFDAGEVDGRFFFASQWVEGKTILEYVRGAKPLSESSALKMGICLGDALRTTWNSEKVLHRAITPRSIFISDDGTVRLRDFGLAKPFSEPIVPGRKGPTFGDARFMAPEQLRGEKKLDPRTDIYSLGLVMYYALTAQLPFDAPTPEASAERHLGEQLPDPRQFNPNASGFVCGVLERMLGIEPQYRYLSWEDAIGDMHRALNRESLTAKTMPIGKSVLKLGAFERKLAEIVAPISVTAEPATASPPKKASAPAPIIEPEVAPAPSSEKKPSTPAFSVTAAPTSPPPAIIPAPAVNAPAIPEETKPVSAPPKKSSRAALVAVAATVLVCIGIVYWMVSNSGTPSSPPPPPPVAQDEQPKPPAPPAQEPKVEKPVAEKAPEPPQPPPPPAPVEQPKDPAAEFKQLKEFSDANPKEFEKNIEQLKKFAEAFPNAPEAQQAKQMIEQFAAKQAEADAEKAKFAADEQKRKEAEQVRRRELEEQRQAEEAKQKEEARQQEQERQSLAQLQTQMAGAFDEFLKKFRVALAQRDYAKAAALTQETSRDGNFAPFSEQLAICSDVTRRLKKFGDSFNTNLAPLKGRTVTLRGSPGKIAEIANGEITLERPQGSVGVGVATASTADILALADLMSPANPADAALEKAWFSIAEGKAAQAVAYLEVARAASSKATAARLSMGMLFPEFSEFEAERLIAQFRELTGARKWSEALAVMKQLKERYAQTKAYRIAQPRLAGTESTLAFYDELQRTPAGAAFRTFQCPQYVSCLAISPDSRYVVTGNQGMLKLWDIVTGQSVREFENPSLPVTAVAFSPDGRFIVSNGYRDQQGITVLKKWEVSSGRETLAFEGTSSLPISFTPDGRYVVGADTVIKVWDANSGKKTKEFGSQGGALRSLSVSANGRTAATAGHGRVVEIWDLIDGAKIKSLQSPTQNIFSVTLMPDGKSLAMIFPDTTMKLWDVEGDKETRSYEGRVNVNVTLALSPDGRYLAAGDGSRPKLWDVAASRAVRTFNGHAGNMRCLALSADRRFAISGGDDRTVRVWKLWDGDPMSSSLSRTTP